MKSESGFSFAIAGQPLEYMATLFSTFYHFDQPLLCLRPAPAGKEHPSPPLPSPMVGEVLAVYIIWTASRLFLSLSLM